METGPGAITQNSVLPDTLSEAYVPDKVLASDFAKADSNAEQSPAIVATATFRSILTKPGVRPLWLASFISYVGDTFGTVALFILVNSATHSTAALAAVGLIQVLPLLFAVPAGALVDRLRYRPVLLAADFVRAALLPLYLVFQSLDDLWVALVVAAAISIASRFFFPASNALRRALLEPDEYAVAASLWQATYGVSYVMGPALAGILISAFGSNTRLGLASAFLLDSASFLLSGLIILALVGDRTKAVDDARRLVDRSPALEDLREGWKIMWRSRALRGVVVLYSVGLLGVGAVFVLTVPFVRRVFGGGALEIGLLEAAQALGLAIGATATGTLFLRRIPPGRIMLLASIVGSISVAGLGLVRLYIAALVIMCAAGVAAGAVEAAGATLTMHKIPQQHQGKVIASVNTIINFAYLMSIALAGLCGDLIGIQGTFVVGGAIAFVGVFMALPLLGRIAEPLLESIE